MFPALPMKIATFNVNGIRSRLGHLLEWLAKESPDVVCLQELKAFDENFLALEIRAEGYQSIWKGQRSWNGVAILAKDELPIERMRVLPGDAADEQSRYLEATVNGVVIELSEAELERLGIREIRYDLVDVTDQVDGEDLPERIVTYTAKEFHFKPEPPEGAVILATYALACERAFDALGPGELERYLETTGPYPVERVDATLIRDARPEGNPRAW